MKKITHILFVSATLLLFSCSSNNTENITNNNDTTNLQDDATQQQNKTQQVFYSLPSPFELASLLRSSGAKFNGNILNSPDNISKYSTANLKAINLGVYGADLSYSSIFSQTTHIMKYLKSVKQLSDELGINAAFDESSMKRLEKNQANDDSLQQIVADAYLIANSYLKESDREEMSSLILAGGWMEGLYIATQLIKEGSKSEGLNEMVADQRFALENLISIFENYSTNTEAQALAKEFNELKAVYDQASVSEGKKVEVKTDSKKGVTVIGGGETMALSTEQIQKITETISAIRNKYVQ
jgi:hypothetical protein